MNWKEQIHEIAINAITECIPKMHSGERLARLALNKGLMAVSVPAFLRGWYRLRRRKMTGVLKYTRFLTVQNGIQNLLCVSLLLLLLVVASTTSSSHIYRHAALAQLEGTINGDTF